MMRNFHRAIVSGESRMKRCDGSGKSLASLFIISSHSFGKQSNALRDRAERASWTRYRSRRQDKSDNENTLAAKATGREIAYASGKVAKVVSLTRAITLTSPRGLFSFAVQLARRVSCPSFDGRHKHEARSSANRRNRRAKYDAMIIVPLTRVYSCAVPSRCLFDE